MDPAATNSTLQEAPVAAELKLGEEPAGSLSPLEPSAPSLDAFKRLIDSLGIFKAQSLEQLLPALRIIGLAVVAGVGLKLTGAVLAAIDELPLLGQLLQLVGLVTAIQFLARNALQQKKRAALLARIEELKANLLG
jgi:hypothetical protein